MTAIMHPYDPPTIDDLPRAKPPVNYPRRIYITVNLCLLVLVPILLILAWSAFRGYKADHEDREHAEYCQTMEEIFEQVPSDCP